MSRTVRASFALAVLMVASTAGATSFIIPSDAQMIAKSDGIVIGTLEGSYVRRGGPNADTAIETVYEVRVERGLKGTFAAGDLLRLVEPGGEIGGFGIEVPGVAHLVQGERALLFVSQHKDHWEVTDLMLGKFRFAATPASGVLVRDTDELESATPTRSRVAEPARTAEGFVRFIEERVAGRPAASNYLLNSSASGLVPQSDALPTRTEVAIFTADTYTQKGASTLGVRWSNSNAVALNYFRRTGGGSDIGSPDTGITNALTSWTNDCTSLVVMHLAGTTTTAAGASATLGGLCGASCPFDEVNVIEFNDPQTKVGGGTWTGTGVIAITFITFNTAAGTASDGVGTNFREILDADIVFHLGYNPSTEPTYATAVTHELGHSIGWRHSNASPSTPNGSTVNCNASTEDCDSSPTTGASIMYWLANSAFGSTLQPWDQRAVRAVYPGGACTIVRQDFNGDGKSDIILRNSSTGDIYEYLMNGTTLTSGVFIGNPGISYDVATLGDYNGDGKADIALQNSVTNDIAIWLMNGNTLLSGVLVGNPGTGWKAVGTADFNGDGKSDIVLQNQSTGDVAVWLMNGGTITGGAVLGTPGPQYKVVGAGDFNADGKADVVLQNTTTGDMAVWLLNGLTITGGAVIGGAGPAWQVRGVGDVNLDGKADIFLRNSSTGDVAVWEMNGFTILAGIVIGNPGAGYDVRGPADFNGDGRSDLLLQKTTTGDVAEWLLNGGTITGGAVVATPGSTFVAIAK